MEEKTESCVLGGFCLVRRIPAVGQLKARDVYLAEFTPSRQGFQLMQQVADGIRGIAAVVQTIEKDTTFALVFDDGVDPDEVTDLWIPAFRRAARRVRPGMRTELVGGNQYVPPDPIRELMETYSDRYSSADS